MGKGHGANPRLCLKLSEYLKCPLRGYAHAATAKLDRWYHSFRAKLLEEPLGYVETGRELLVCFVIGCLIVHRAPPSCMACMALMTASLLNRHFRGPTRMTGIRP